MEPGLARADFADWLEVRGRDREDLSMDVAVGLGRAHCDDTVDLRQCRRFSRLYQYAVCRVPRSGLLCLCSRPSKGKLEPFFFWIPHQPSTSIIFRKRDFLNRPRMEKRHRLPRHGAKRSLQTPSSDLPSQTGQQIVRRQEQRHKTIADLIAAA